MSLSLRDVRRRLEPLVDEVESEAERRCGDATPESDLWQDLADALILILENLPGARVKKVP